jgi:DnaJ-class molecular chaperone
MTPEPDLNPGDEVAPGTEQSGEAVCPTCSGSGRLDDDAPCPDCGGTGKVVALVGDA